MVLRDYESFVMAKNIDILVDFVDIFEKIQFFLSILLAFIVVIVLNGGSCVATFVPRFL
jgi:hypothetical protein